GRHQSEWPADMTSEYVADFASEQAADIVGIHRPRLGGSPDDAGSAAALALMASRGEMHG
ncbi:hypothetical protein ACFQX4_28470, partial [Roseomonas sp. GCM10028921]